MPRKTKKYSCTDDDSFMTSGLPLENCIEDDINFYKSTVQKNRSSTRNLDHQPQSDLSLERTMSGKKDSLTCRDDETYYIKDFSLKVEEEEKSKLMMVRKNKSAKRRLDPLEQRDLDLGSMFVKLLDNFEVKDVLSMDISSNDSSSLETDSFMINIPNRKKKKNDDDSNYVTHRKVLKPSKQLFTLCHLSKNLYNYGNYLLRSQYAESRKWGVKELTPGKHSGLIKEIRSSIKGSSHYKALNAQTSQQTLRYLSDAWNSYFEKLERFYQNPSEYSGKPNIPKYKPKHGEYTVVFTGQQIQTKIARKHFEASKKAIFKKNREGINVYSGQTAEILFPKRSGLSPIRIRIDLNGIVLNPDIFHEVRFIPRGVRYNFEVVYKKKFNKLPESYFVKDRVLGGDLGVNVLLAITNNFGKHPVLIKGDRIKRANFIAHKKNRDLHVELFKDIHVKLKDFNTRIPKGLLEPCVRVLIYYLGDRLRDFRSNKKVIRFVSDVLDIRRLADTSMDGVTFSTRQCKNLYEAHADFEKYIKYSDYMVSEKQYEMDKNTIGNNLLGKRSIDYIRGIIEGILKIVKSWNLRVNFVWHRRNERVRDCIHKASTYLVEYAIEHKVPTIVIGYNKGWKQKSNMGRRNNQNFQSVPFLRFLEMIRYKCENKGIKCVEISESYTSKCSALDFEPIMKHDKYLGIRGVPILDKNGVPLRNKDKNGVPLRNKDKNVIKARGLFRSKDGLIIHSDVHDAFNIMRFGVEGCLDGYNISNMLLSPVSIDLFPVKKKDQKMSSIAHA